MKKQFALLGLAVVLFGGCDKDDFCNCLQSEGPTTTEMRAIPDFAALELNQNVDVILKQGPVPAVAVTCGAHLIDGIETEVKDNCLYIRNKNRCNWLRDFKNQFTVEITYTQLLLITNNGSGDLTCRDTIVAPVFQIDNWNATGTVRLLLRCDEARLKIHTGPADLYAAGHTNVMYMYNSSNGYIRAGALTSNYSYITTKSTGDCEVNSNLDLRAEIEYVGNVYYKGNPAYIYSNITGSGKLIPF